MSHYFGIDEIKQKLVMISALTLSGEEFCKRYHMGSPEYYKVYNLEDYTKLTKLMVSNNLIEIAVKLRCLVGSLKAQKMPIELSNDIKIYNVGRCADGKSQDKDFRFICNKIIHADKFNLDFVGKRSYHKDMVWWSGMVTLSGSFYKKEWGFFFSVLALTDQIMSFLKEAEVIIQDLQENSYDLQAHS